MIERRIICRGNHTIFWALQPSVRSRIEHSGNADIVIGVSFHSSAHTIIHVLRMMNRRIDRYYPDKWAVVVAPDGGSTDGTGDSARFADPKSYSTLQSS